MAIWQGKSLRKSTGGRGKANRNKRKIEFGRAPAETKIGDKKIKNIRTKGGNRKIRLANDNRINVLDPKNKKVQLVEIMGVLENTANIQFVRRNIINKGAMVETSLGRVKVTSRPGQHGMVNGVLVE